MINSLKILETQRYIRDRSDYNKDKVIKQLFLDFPKLEKINFSKTNEYNDNDYSDYMRVISINNHPVVDGDYDYDDEDEDLSKIPKDKLFHEMEIEHICYIIEGLCDYFDTNNEDDYQTLLRKDVLKTKEHKKNREDMAFDAYNDAIKNQEPVSDFSIFHNFPNWGLYYCIEMNSKFPEKELEKIFASKNNNHWIRYAYYYAKDIIKNRLPEKIESKIKTIEKSIQLKSFEKENYYLSCDEKQARYYSEKYREFVKSLN